MLKVHALIFLLAVSFPGDARTAAASAAAAPNLAARTSDEGGVRVVVTPHDRVGESWEFGIVLDTHSQALNDDMAGSSLLIVDDKPYRPSAWSGMPPGGHHRQGTLRFEAIPLQAQVMELRIRLAGDGSPRIFTWRTE